MNNPYWENITKIAEKQRAKGLEEYGQGLEDNTAPNFTERINYIEEELVDALMYLEWLKDSKQREKADKMFTHKARALYSAYLKNLSKLSDKLYEEQADLPMILGMRASADFVQTIRVHEGFDPIEVLDGLTKQLTEENIDENN